MKNPTCDCCLGTGDIGNDIDGWGPCAICNGTGELGETGCIVDVDYPEVRE